MLLHRFEDSGLAQYSYAVGCPGAGEIFIVDPRRDVDVYLDYAAREGLRIAGVLETHIHADFASGARELAERTGAPAYASAHDAGETFEVAFPHEDLHDGQELRLGGVRVQAVHTPGHTPEHLSFLLFDENRAAAVPMACLTGDFVFVGSLGRPDLLGEEAKVRLAQSMYRSVQQLARLPDGLEIHPGHGAGSMCGAGMSGRPCTTLGYERIANPFLAQGLAEAEFVDRLLSSVPPFPDYYRRMKQVNAQGAPSLEELPGAAPLSPAAAASLLADGGVAVDIRDEASFGGGHIPGAFGIPRYGGMSTWASWVVPYDTPIVLVTPDGALDADAVRSLVRVGLDSIAGYVAGGFPAWAQAGQPVARLEQASATDVGASLAGGSPQVVIDVRASDEYASGHIPGAVAIPAGELPRSLDRLPDGDSLITLVCETGYRSTVAASVLDRSGHARVRNIAGGMRAWRAAGLPIDRAG